MGNQQGATAAAAPDPWNSPIGQATSPQSSDPWAPKPEGCNEDPWPSPSRPNDPWTGGSAEALHQAPTPGKIIIQHQLLLFFLNCVVIWKININKEKSHQG